MAHISGFERSQLLLLPEAIDDYVDEPDGIVDAFVDGLSLVEVGFARVQPKATGRPGYTPGDLLKGSGPLRELRGATLKQRPYFIFFPRLVRKATDKKQYSCWF